MSCNQTFPIEDSQGSQFFFDSVEYAATNVDLSVEGETDSDQQVDVTTLSIDSGCCRVKVDPPLYDCGDTTSDGTLTVQFYWTKVLPAVDQVAQLQFPKFNIDQQAKCTGYQLTATVGEFVTGSATFDLKK